MLDELALLSSYSFEKNMIYFSVLEQFLQLELSFWKKELPLELLVASKKETLDNSTMTLIGRLMLSLGFGTQNLGCLLTVKLNML